MKHTELFERAGNMWAVLLAEDAGVMEIRNPLRGGLCCQGVLARVFRGKKN